MISVEGVAAARSESQSAWGLAGAGWWLRTGISLTVCTLARQTGMG